jgi:esterase FrsA
MNEIEELKRYGMGHARAQRIPARRYAEVCARVRSDEDGPGSWVGEWSAVGAQAAARGRHLEACGAYNLARFPYIDGPAREVAQRRCSEECARWAASAPGIERTELAVLGQRVPCWTSGLSGAAGRPLLLVTGGIVSVKEQWAPLLRLSRGLRMAMVVTEMPGVGENPLRYTKDSWRMISAILDAVGDRADVSRTYALALSFSGHAALRAAAHDSRVRAVLTVAAPVHDFFGDASWHARLPRLTTDTLAALTCTPPDALGEHLRDWAITPAELAALDIPVRYVAADEDEIIPMSEPCYLQEHAPDVAVLSYADQHAGPRHATETRLWLLLSLLRVRRQHSLNRAVLACGWHALRARRRLAESLT